METAMAVAFKELTRSVPEFTGQYSIKGKQFSKGDHLCLWKGWNKGWRQSSGKRKRQWEGGTDNGGWYYPWIMILPCGWKSGCPSGQCQETRLKRTSFRPWWLTVRKRCSLVGQHAPWEDTPGVQSTEDRAKTGSQSEAPRTQIGKDHPGEGEET